VVGFLALFAAVGRPEAPLRVPVPALVLAAALLPALGCGACSSPEDRAAKERIFSPEDPPRVLRAAAEPLDATALAQNPALVDRIVGISAQEAAARLGPHTQKAKVRFGWTLGERTVALKENRTVELGKDGDFHVVIENDQGQGMEWYRVGTVSYARNRYAPLRERRRDRGSSEHVVASGYESLQTFYDVVHRAFRLTAGGEATHRGRPVVKYTVSLGEARAAAELEGLPALQFPKDGPDPDTALRLEAREKGVPTRIDGVLYVDRATAVPVRADLEAEVKVPGENGEARLVLAVDLDVEGFGKEGKIVVPDHLEDEPRPPGVVSILDAYGLPRAGGEKKDADAKTPAEPEDEE
jgi:hypothetical protein